MPETERILVDLRPGSLYAFAGIAGPPSNGRPRWSIPPARYRLICVAKRTAYGMPARGVSVRGRQECRRVYHRGGEGIGEGRVTITAVQLNQLSKRKRRLFACACARSVQDLLTDFRSWEAVEVAERFADGAATEADRGKASASAPWAFGNALVTIGAICASTNGAYTHALLSWLSNTPACPAAAILDDLWPPRECERCKGKGVAHVGWDSGDLKCRDCHGSGRIAWQPTLCGESRKIHVTDLCAYKCLPLFTWHNRLIPAMAQAIYDERRYEDMPILADALEDAGCTNAEILNHCRQPGDHWRGCWVLDTILGKN